MQSIQQIVSIQIRQNAKPSGTEEFMRDNLFFFVSPQAVCLIGKFGWGQSLCPLQASTDSFDHPGTVSIILDRLNNDGIGKRLPRVFFTFDTAGFSDSQCNSSHGQLNKGTLDSSTPACILSL